MGINNPIDGSLAASAFVEAQAREVQYLRSGTERALLSSRIWPRRTGRSISLFRVKVVRSRAARARGGVRLTLTNAAPYASIVENRPRYPNGAPNPNYHAARRTVLRYLNGR